MVTMLTLQDMAPTTQPLLYFPADFAANNDKFDFVEFEQLSAQTMKMTLVDEKARLKNKRYKIVRHNGGTWTSVPKTWLKMCGAKTGDSIDVAWNNTFAVLTLKRKKPNDSQTRPSTGYQSRGTRPVRRARR